MSSSDVSSPSLLRAPGAVSPAYAELLRGARGLSREQSQAREAWFAALPREDKEDAVFELEALLKGVACFASPRNHPSAGRRGAAVDLDFHEHLRLAQGGMARVVELAGSMLDERARAPSLLHDLEIAIADPKTHASHDLGSSAPRSSPTASLASLRRAFIDAMAMQEGILRGPRVGYRVFRASLSTATRATAQSCFFSPLAALDFRPELDHITSVDVLEILKNTRGAQASRLVAIAFLSLFRALRYLDVIDAIALDHADPRCAGRAYLVLAALRSDARALSIDLGRRSGGLLAEGFERDLARVPASDVAAREGELRAEAARLALIHRALLGLAASLRLEMRRAFEHELPPISARASIADLRASLEHVTSSLRAGLQVATIYLARSLGARLDEGRAFGQEAPSRAMSERLRRDVWMFAHIARAFASKARHADAIVDRWTAGASASFVRDFLAYFRAMGYPLLCASGYPRVEPFMAAMKSLEEIDPPDDARTSAAVHECETFYAFLTRLFEQISRRDELAGVPFDRRDAARALRLYLGD